jgi:hypothetical protein
LQRHCDAWVAFARHALAAAAGAPAASIATWTIRNGQWEPPNTHTTKVVAVVTFQLVDGSIVQVPV